MTCITSQKGFTPVLLLIIVVVVGVAGFFGWQAYTTSTVKQESTTIVSQNETVSQTPKATVTPSQAPQGNSDEINSQILKDIVGHGVTCESEITKDTGDKGSCTVDTIVGNYAKGKMPQAYWIAVKTNNTWKVAVTGNGIPKCEEIDTYSIPKEIYGNCIEESGELRH